MNRIAVSQEVKPGAQDDHQQHQRGQPIGPVEEQRGEKERQGQAGRNISSARDGDRDTGQEAQRGVTQEDFAHGLKPAHQSVSQAQRQQHFQKPTQVIWRDVRARAIEFMRHRDVPHPRGVGEELVNGIEGNRHRQENQRARDNQHGLLPVQIVEGGEEQAGIDQDVDQLLPGDVFDVRGQVPADGENDEGGHGPADRRP